jgi:DNA-binding transcriptional MerR regulator
MSKSISQPQGIFSFFDGENKTEIVLKPKSNTLRPPEIIEIDDAEPSQPQKIISQNTETITTETASVAKIINQHLEVEWKEANNTIDEEDIAVKRTQSSRGRRSVKENSLAAEMIELPDDEELFKKQYYSMGEVTAMLNENHSLIRYWENEFDILHPRKNGKGDRFFRPEDVKNLYLIYDLLRRRMFTIDGAREYLKNNKKAEERFTAIQSLQKIKSFFLELKANL